MVPFRATGSRSPTRLTSPGLRVNLPRPDRQERPSDCEDIDVINTLDGFNLQPRLSIPFSGVLTLALGTGASTAFFSIVNAALIRPLGYADWDRLVTVTTEVEVRGRDVPQRSFVGIAFRGLDDNTDEAVYLRPFNFRAEDPARRQNAVQYIAVPEYDWPRLRKEFRIVAKGQTVQVFVGATRSPALEVRKLGPHDRGMVGLWTGNNSNGAFANLRITPPS